MEFYYLANWQICTGVCCSFCMWTYYHSQISVVNSRELCITYSVSAGGQRSVEFQLCNFVFFSWSPVFYFLYSTIVFLLFWLYFVSVLIGIICVNLGFTVYEISKYKEPVSHSMQHSDTLSLGPHCAYFRMRKLKSQVAKVSTVRVEKIFALAVQHATVDAFATCGFNVRMRKYALCGPRLILLSIYPASVRVKYSILKPHNTL